MKTSNETKSLRVGEGMKNIDFKSLEEEEAEVTKKEGMKNEQKNLDL
jgi:hypothetical protein